MIEGLCFDSNIIYEEGGSFEGPENIFRTINNQ
jgi:hypothetical protein